MIELFVSWIDERRSSATFSTTKDFRDSQYQKWDELKQRRNAKLEQIREKVLQEVKKEAAHETETLFLTF